MIDERMLLRYLDGELDEETAAAVAGRIRRDPALERRAAELRAVEAAYSQTGDDSLPSERRQALLERLRRAPAAAHYDPLHRGDLEALVEVRSPYAPVFSLYLDLDPARQVSEPPLARFKGVLRQAEQKLRPDQQSQLYREQWAEETDRLRTWLGNERSLQGRGLAVLSCQAIGLWRAFRLPVPVHDHLEIADRPYLRPLATLLDELIDEALEETFPASDPPFWMPAGWEQ